MKITCTKAEKEWLVQLMAISDQCPMNRTCDGACEDCCEKNVEWTIDESAGPGAEGKLECGECVHYIGGGDWDLCCELPHPEYPYGHLCYEWTKACERFEGKDGTHGP